jgi:hypothetical protein
MLILNLLLVTFALVGSLAAFGGETWEKGAGPILQRVTSRGWAALACLFLAFALGVVKEILLHRKSKAEAIVKAALEAKNTRQQTEINQQLNQIKELQAQLKSSAFHIAHIQAARQVPRLSAFPFWVAQGAGVTQYINGAGTFVPFGNPSDESTLKLRATEDRSIFVTMEIRNETGAVVALLRDSHLFVSPGLAYDVNSDLTAIEVVDEQLRPVLQVYRSNNPETLQVNYVKFEGDPLSMTVCNALGCLIGPEPSGEGADKWSKVRESKWGQLKRIFEYPGYKYPGVKL